MSAPKNDAWILCMTTFTCTDLKIRQHIATPKGTDKCWMLYIANMLPANFQVSNFPSFLGVATNVIADLKLSAKNFLKKYHR